LPQLPGLLVVPKIGRVVCFSLLGLWLSTTVRQRQTETKLVRILLVMAGSFWLVWKDDLGLLSPCHTYGKARMRLLMRSLPGLPFRLKMKRNIHFFGL
jgi:hypothetical protein